MEERAVYKTRSLPEREADIVETIREGLTWLGFTVLRVGQHRADRSGTDRGCPDLLVTRDGWGVFLGLEVKTLRGRTSPAQRHLAVLGAVHVVHSFEEALEVVNSHVTFHECQGV